ncbi:MAG TPA: class I SAM-dependent methyltransferase [Armatimonadetes bacterium]|nr:class I SAM-dependent methyltransferase [Armatimonadota bacterium]
MKFEHYFSYCPAAPPNRRLLHTTLRGEKYQFYTEASVFSRDRIDAGTRLLVETMDIQPGDTVADWGCGYGPLGLVAARLAYPGQCYLVDINRRAVALAWENARLNGLSNVWVWVGDGFSAVEGQPFTVVVSNPPLRAGKKVVSRLVEEAFRCLRPGGRLYLVARTRQGAKSLLRQVEAIFSQAETVARKGGYRVFRAERARSHE